MEYQCVNARFRFFDGQKTLTVEYTYGIQTWYVFNEDETSGCLWHKKINPANHKSPNRVNAETILEEYLETVAA